MPAKKTTNVSKKATATTKVTPPAPNKKKTSPWVWILVSCLGLVALSAAGFILLLVFIFKIFAGPIEPANQQLKFIREGELVQAYNLGSTDFKKATSEADFEEFIKDNPELEKNKKANFNSSNIEGNTAKIRGTITSTDGSEIPVEYRMVKENGKWKIYYFTLNPDDNINQSQ
ncbi:MAG: DUF4864 domain-containing protein [bacterium]|nr:DUF4864 domain-containing protein [bacterium]